MDATRHRPGDETILIETVFSESYVQTKHKNLRCFPKCAVLHAEQRFCGRPIHARVLLATSGGAGPIPLPTPRHNLVTDQEDDAEAVGGSKGASPLTQSSRSNEGRIVFGELRNVSDQPLFAVGDECPKAALEELNERVFLGQPMSRSATDNNESQRFTIPPPRKWHYPGKLKDGEKHVCQLYLAKHDRIVSTVISTSFSISPIWKSDRTTATTSEPKKPTAQKRLKLAEEEDRSEPVPPTLERILTPPNQIRRLNRVPAVPVAPKMHPDDIQTPPEQRRRLAPLPGPFKEEGFHPKLSAQVHHFTNAGAPNSLATTMGSGPHMSSVPLAFLPVSSTIPSAIRTDVSLGKTNPAMAFAAKFTSAIPAGGRQPQQPFPQMTRTASNNNITASTAHGDNQLPQRFQGFPGAGFPVTPLARGGGLGGAMTIPHPTMTENAARHHQQQSMMMPPGPGPSTTNGLVAYRPMSILGPQGSSMPHEAMMRNPTMSTPLMPPMMGPPITHRLLVPIQPTRMPPPPVAQQLHLQQTGAMNSLQHLAQHRQGFTGRSGS